MRQTLLGNDRKEASPGRTIRFSPKDSEPKYQEIGEGCTKIVKAIQGMPSCATLP